MTRKSRKQRAIAQEKGQDKGQDEVLDEMRERLKARLDELRDDPIPAESQPQMRDAMRQAVTYSAPVPVR